MSSSVGRTPARPPAAKVAAACERRTPAPAFAPPAFSAPAARAPQALTPPVVALAAVAFLLKVSSHAPAPWRLAQRIAPPSNRGPGSRAAAGAHPHRAWAPGTAAAVSQPQGSRHSSEPPLTGPPAAAGAAPRVARARLRASAAQRLPTPPPSSTRTAGTPRTSCTKGRSGWRRSGTSSDLPPCSSCRSPHSAAPCRHPPQASSVVKAGAAAISRGEAGGPSRPAAGPVERWTSRAGMGLPGWQTR
mmetsp:Transcript_6851/g.20803  ORF Transcript_6851/g.20803 Transcript_6851/m.20803 type:complete len:246 (-) Transcript_6851:37-774(-)